MDVNIYNYFYPKSICVVGASTKEKSIGYEILKSIKEFSYTGKVFPVNPKAKYILDFKCYLSIENISDDIDLAIIVVPKQFVDVSIDQLIAKNVKSIVLITAGFRETGEDGKIHEDNLLNKIRKNNVRLVGPNCMGIINTLESIKLNATFVAETPARGGIAFLSQSGALGAAVLNSLRETDIRFAHFISIGNKADISENDLLQFWLEDDNINTIAFYSESIENGLDLIKKYKDANHKKPLIILKAGRTKSGMKAASSHTGALSNNDKIINSLFEQFGIIRSKTINEMFNTAKGFENFPIPKGNKIAVITNAGGPAILAVDKLEERNLVIAELTDITKNRLKEIVHPEGSVNNPVDLLPGGTPELYKKVNEIISEDNNVDSIISIFVEPVMVNAFDVIDSVNSIISDKPIYQVCMPLPEFWENYRNKSKYGKPIFRNPEDPAEIISNILLFETRKNLNNVVDFKKSDFVKSIYESYFIDQNKVISLCKNYNIPIVEQNLLSLNDINNYSDFIYPIVVKGISKDLIHKSELNAVKLNIKNRDNLLTAIEEINLSFKKNNLEVEQFLVQPFIKTKHEILVGGFRDPSFGAVIMFGTGGKYVEVIDDTQIKSAYLNEYDLDEIISKTKIGKILQGVRGERSCDIPQLKMLIKSVARLMIENNEITEIDLNPIIIDENKNYFAVDVRIKSLSQ